MNHLKTYGILLMGIGLAVLGSGCSGAESSIANTNSQEETTMEEIGTELEQQSVSSGAKQSGASDAEQINSVLESLSSVDVFPADSSESVLPYEGGILLSNISDGNGGYISFYQDGNLEILIPKEAGLKGPTGMAEKEHYLFVADYVSTNPENVIYEVENLQEPEAKAVNGVNPGRYDGVTFSDDNRILYFTDWVTASVTAMDVESGEMKTIYHEDGIGPADIDVAGDTLYIPEMSGNRIIALTNGR